jgi:tryptophanyl-tRNA synthetase
MSKSYDNIIPLFANEKQLRKLIMKIKTNSLEPGVPKDPKDSVLYDIYSAFAMPEEILNIEKLYANGLAWGEMKNILFECINDQLKPAREEYQKLIDDPAQIEVKLKKGAERAREISVPYIQEIRNAIGIRKLI